MSYKIDKDVCFGCGLCSRQCPVGAISVSDYTAPDKRKPALQIDTTKCIKCGMCASACKFHAIEKK